MFEKIKRLLSSLLRGHLGTLDLNALAYLVSETEVAGKRISVLGTHGQNALVCRLSSQGSLSTKNLPSKEIPDGALIFGFKPWRTEYQHITELSKLLISLENVRARRNP